MDGTCAVVPGCAAALPVLPEGEVWVAMPYKPAFPRIVPADETPPGSIENPTRFPVLHNPDNDVEIGSRCRPAVARSSRTRRNVETAPAKLAAELGR
ncbi:hypothetical protein ACFQ68_08435 [Amycolatopsis japonica]|uniref:hypothetical protein n=1 Tax=Amycolatopsis japonica TaxID=208439 RepID=UPI00366D86BF